RIVENEQTERKHSDRWLRSINVRFGSKADMCGALGHVCFTPESGHVQCSNACLLWANSRLMQCNNRLFDHFVGSHQQRWRNCKAERLGSLEVDHQLKLGRLLDWQIRRLSSFQYLIYIAGRTTPDISQVRSVRHKPSELHRFTIVEDTWQACLGCKLRDESSICVGCCTRPNEDSLGLGAVDLGEGVLVLMGKKLGEHERQAHGLRGRPNALPPRLLPVAVFVAAEIGDARKAR